MKVYQLGILTPEKKIYNDTVVSITVSGGNGQLTILAGHAPMVAVLAKGPVIIRTEKETLVGETDGGVLQVSHNEAVIMVHSFKWAGDESEEEDIAEERRTDDLII